MSTEQKAFRRSLYLKLLELRDPSTGAWTGELASSALGTALALAALMDDPSFEEQTQRSVAWLVNHQNKDGGWGDTTSSQSNISTTLLTRAALSALQRSHPSDAIADAIRRSTEWIAERTEGPSFSMIVKALSRIYGEDRTFAIPILTFLAICEDDDRRWKEIPPLPFIFALLPQGLYRFFKLGVVSYALPALIAIGMCRNRQVAGRWKRVSQGFLFAKPLLAKLEKLQPSHGGFLDAIPLTAFVALALKKMGYATHPVTQRSLLFLKASFRQDGSYAIDSNLRTWVTSLTTRALLTNEDHHTLFPLEEKEKTAEWLVDCQRKTVHPYTGAQPGGWAWTDCEGGVPDADDTSAALVALYRLRQQGVTFDMKASVRAGLRWLMKLQNSDGGIPTFCRGWGRLPFDRSCPDITAHAILACTLWRDHDDKVDACLARMIDYLRRTQLDDGSWIPLWFGNEEAVDASNPVIGTARAIDALRQTQQAGYPSPLVQPLITKGVAWLLGHQLPDGSWGASGRGTNEETGLAVIALRPSEAIPSQDAVLRGQRWLMQQGLTPASAPLGLYFSLLWYHEQMYPLVWTLEALRESDRYEQ
jgi:squalene-hopene/tetraprenyl-beta-curcumene cyclase